MMVNYPTTCTPWLSPGSVGTACQAGVQEEKISVTLPDENTQIRASVAMFDNRSDIAHLLEVLAKMA